jgi:flagellar biosynthesis/type III secretory pathway protein FliH
MRIWMSASLHRKPALHGLISLTENLQELKTMLDHPDRWTRWAEEYKAQGEMLGLEKGMEKGIEKGMEKGLDKGKHDGLATAALLLLENRFPPLPDWVAPRLAQASEAQLQAYLTGILSAASLNELFDRGGPAH